MSYIECLVNRARCTIEHLGLTFYAALDLTMEQYSSGSLENVQILVNWNDH